MRFVQQHRVYPSLGGGKQIFAALGAFLRFEIIDPLGHFGFDDRLFVARTRRENDAKSKGYAYEITKMEAG